MASDIYNRMDAVLFDPVMNFISTASNGVSGYVTAPLALGFTIYVLVHGGAMVLGRTQDPISGLLVNMIRYGFILVLIGTSGRYADWIVDIFFNSLPQELANAVNGSPPSVNTFDALLDQGWAIAGKIWNSAGTWSLSSQVVTGIGGFLVYGAVLFLTIVGYAVWVFAKLALALVLAIGPFFIALALFEATRSYTQQWINHLLNYVILQVLVVALLAMVLSVLQQQITRFVNTAEPLNSVGPVIVVCGLGCFLFFRLPIMAQGLAGGLALGTEFIGKSAWQYSGMRAATGWAGRQMQNAPTQAAAGAAWTGRQVWEAAKGVK